MPNEKDLKEYLSQKRRRLEEIRMRLNDNERSGALFSKKYWYDKVEEQLAIWERNPERSLQRRDISIPEYELFGYFEDDAILDQFVVSFNVLEESLCRDRTRYRKWRESKLRLFSQQTSQIYSTLFELLILGKLISSGLRVEAYFENIDGRIEIDTRFVYFEIKSLQQTRFDFKGVGVGGVQHDEHQILTALKEKTKQLKPYFGKPTLVLMSLYRLADLTTGEWFIHDFFQTEEGRNISGVKVYSWFTARSANKVLINDIAIVPFSEAETNFLNRNSYTELCCT